MFAGHSVSRTFALALGLTAFGFGDCADAAPGPWQQHTLLTAPQEFGYSVGQKVRFGNAVAMSKGNWLAVGVMLGRCQGVTSPHQGGSVVMYRYNTGADSYQPIQQICDSAPQSNAKFGSSIAIEGEWMIVGSPNYPSATNPITAGRVSFYRYDSAQGLWQHRQTITGSGGLGTSVAVANGIAVAGEPYALENRGRVRSWRLESGTWVAEAHLVGPSLQVDRLFGQTLALDLRGCQTFCFEAADMIAVGGLFGVYTSARGSSGWGTYSTVALHPGAEYRYSLAVNNTLLLVSAAVSSPNASSHPCAPINGSYSTFTQVFRRRGGSTAVTADSFACPEQLGIPVGRFPGAMATADRGGEFVIGATELAVGGISTVSTWYKPTSAGPTPVDLVSDLGLAFSPYDDFFGAHVALRPTWLAVGAPSANQSYNLPDAGYVVVYRRTSGSY